MEIPFFRKLLNRLRRRQQEFPSQPETRAVAAPDLLHRWSSYPSTGLTPARLRQIIRGADLGDISAQMELFEEMEERDAHLAAVLQTRRLAVVGLELMVKPYSHYTPGQEGRAQELADFVQQALDRITNFEEGLYNILDAIGKGISVTEIHWVNENGKVLVDRLEWIHPKRLTFAGSEEPRLLTEAEPYYGEEFPPWKTIYFVYRSRSGWDNRAGLLRVVALLFLLKHYALKDWATFNEVYAMPIRLGKYDPASSQADREALYQAVQAIASDAAGIIPKTTEIEFLQIMRGNSENPFLALQQFCNNEMSKAILGQTLTTDTAGATGTYSAGRVHHLVREDLVKADAKALADVLTKQLVFPLIGFNFGWDVARTLCPYIELSRKEEEDLLRLSQTVRNLVESGAPVPVSWVCEKFGIPEAEPGELVLGKPAPALPRLPMTQALRAEAGWDAPVLRQQQELDKIISDAMKTSADLSRIILRPVQRLIDEGRSLEEIQENLEQIYGKIDPQPLADILYAAMMLAYFKGYTESD